MPPPSPPLAVSPSPPSARPLGGEASAAPGIGADFGFFFGLSADGSALAVGAPGVGSNATGVHADGPEQKDNSADGADAVYVY